MTRKKEIKGYAVVFKKGNCVGLPAGHLECFDLPNEPGHPYVLAITDRLSCAKSISRPHKIKSQKTEHQDTEVIKCRIILEPR